MFYGEDGLNGKITTVTIHDILKDYQKYPKLKHYLDNSENGSYLQLVTSAQKFKEDCYYSVLENEENQDLSCVLYNTNDMKIFNNTIGILFFIYLYHIVSIKKKLYFSDNIKIIEKLFLL